MKKILALTILSLVSLFGAAGEEGEHKAYMGVYLQHAGHGHDGDGQQVKGAMITGVIEGSAAQNAGLAAHDVIIEINGVKIDGAAALTDALKNYQPNDEISVRLNRDGDEKTISLKLGERPAARYRIAQNKWLRAWNETPFMGINMQKLNEQMADFFEVANGVLITEVIEDSPAEQAGLKAGDVVIDWNGVKLESTSDLHEELNDSKENDTVTLTIMRKGEMKDLEITLGPPKQRFNLQFGDHALRMKAPIELHHKQLHHLKKRSGNVWTADEAQALKEEIRQLREEIKKLKEARHKEDME